MSDDPEPVDQLSALLESLEDAVIGTDLRGIITSWNSGAERLFGYLSDEAIGQPIASIYPSGKLDEADQILRRIERGERLRDLDTVRRRKDGVNIPVSMTVTPVRAASG